MYDYIGDYIRKLLTYSEGDPMIFTGAYFWGFFTVVFAIFSLIHRRIPLRNLFLLAVSIFFYYKTSGLYFMLLLFTVTSDFFIGHRLYRTTSSLQRKLFLTLSVSINLFILFYFKYAYFFTESYNSIFHSDYTVLNYFAHFKGTITGEGSLMDRIVLPVGISFYTFQAISYTADIYRKKIAPLHRITDFAFFISFFPQLVAGPIVRASEFIPQIHQPFRLSGYQFGLAVFVILSGLLKKMVFADYMAVQFIDKVYANPLIFTSFENLMAVLLYSLQVYLDFSGYTDIAIGVALLMGFRFNINFNSPYKALNVEEFWKRWHISLSTWLRDYLYFPLGGNRHGTAVSYILITLIIIILILIAGDYSYFWKVVIAAVILIVLSRFSLKVKNAVNTNINLMITMLLGGLWHGASWNFITWGGLNGIGLVVFKYWKKISPWQNLHSWYIRAFRIAMTFSFITFTRIWFRAPDKATADAVVNKLSSGIDWSVAPKVISAFYIAFGLFLGGMIIHWLPTRLKRRIRKWFIRSNVAVKVAVVVGVVLLIWQTISAEFVPFIYFQF